MICRVDLTPSKPYFFGNDKRFAYNKQDKSISPYFITGEAVPSQPALLGTMRYLLLKHTGWFPAESVENDENIAAIGKYSFNPDTKEAQGDAGFGLIRGISPLFLYHRISGSRYLPVPLDHDITKNEAYAPFGRYAQMETTEGTKIYAEDYNVKKGLSNAWVCVQTGELLSIDEEKYKHGLFETRRRVGINRDNTNDGFFVRQYTSLHPEFSFAFYVTLDDTADIGRIGPVVMMGQGNTPFSVRITLVEGDDLLQKATENLMRKRQKRYETDDEGRVFERDPWPVAVYCASDMFVKVTPFAGTVFAVATDRNYRPFSTTSQGRITNGTLHHLVRGGSVFLFKDSDGAEDWIRTHSDEYIAISGMNHFVKLWEGAKNK